MQTSGKSPAMNKHKSKKHICPTVHSFVGLWSLGLGENVDYLAQYTKVHE
jgi:hypothetical protein